MLLKHGLVEPVGSSEEGRGEGSDAELEPGVDLVLDADHDLVGAGQAGVGGLQAGASFEELDLAFVLVRAEEVERLVDGVEEGFVEDVLGLFNEGERILGVSGVVQKREFVSRQGVVGLGELVLVLPFLFQVEVELDGEDVLAVFFLVVFGELEFGVEG